MQGSSKVECRCRQNRPTEVRLFLLAIGLLVSTGLPAEEVALQQSEVGKAVEAKLHSYSGVSNADESVRVSGECLTPIDKHILMQFIEDVRKRLEMLLDVSFSGDAYRIALYAENAEADRPGTVTKTMMSPAIGAQRLPTIRITLVNPNQVDAHDLAHELCDALVCMKIRVASGGAKTQEPPASWFTAGLAHYLDTSTRQADAEEVISLWQRAQIQPLWMLPKFYSAYASADRRIAAQLVAYWLDFPDRGKRLETLCRALASGEEWSPQLFVETSSRLFDIAEADKNFDVWLLDRRGSVLTLGVTRRELIVRAKRSVLLSPLEDGADGSIPAWSSPAVLLDHAGEPWAKNCAKLKIKKIMCLSAGRGEKFRQAAIKYAEYFDGIVREESPRKLRATLRLAEILMAASEEPPRSSTVAKP